MRTFGVEEEFLVVDPETGRPLPKGDLIVARHRQFRGHRRFDLTTEVQREQVESVTGVCHTLDDLESALRLGRIRADSLARQLGARVVALGTSPLPVEPHITGERRYHAVAARLGLAAFQQISCGCHVHVGVASDEEAVGVLDRIRVWAPVLLALSANSPYWNGTQTDYMSFRRVLCTQLPISGPTEIFGSAAAYHEDVKRFLGTKVILDKGMISFDARLCRDHPTVEIRVADVCLEVQATVLLAALIRALVATAAHEWANGVAPPPVSTPMLRLALWQASKSGLTGMLLDPEDFRPRKAVEVVSAMVDHVRPALSQSGDESRVVELVQRLFSRGTGAQIQIACFESSGDFGDVVAEATSLTHQFGQSS
jgi:carboxylate-amine ligase